MSANWLGVEHRIRNELRCNEKKGVFSFDGNVYWAEVDGELSVI